MTIKEQLVKVKQNWFLIALPIILIIVLLSFGGLLSFVGPMLPPSSDTSSYGGSMGYAERDYAPAPTSSMPSRIYAPDFAPEQKARLIAKTARLLAEVERGMFPDAASKLKSAVGSSGALMLSEDVQVNEKGTRKEYTQGSYDIKVESGKYDALVSALKDIGKTLTFSEDAEDVTGTYTDANVELASQKAHLARYQEMYDQATLMEDKISLADKMLDLENQIKYMEQSLENLGKQVSYSTVHMSISEKSSDYADIEFVKASTLAAGLVGSTSVLVVMAVAILPWAIAVLIIVMVVRRLRRKGRR